MTDSRSSKQPEPVSPLATWFADEAAVRRFRRRTFSRTPANLPARDRTWRRLTPDFDGAVALAASGVPFQIAAERRYERSGDARRLGPALRTGATVFLPQVHQLLPRLARLMVALRHAFCGPDREECSFLFVVEGTGRPGMGLHHDDDVDSFWIQLAGRRTVTVGPPVPRGTPPDLDDRLADAAEPRRGGPGGSGRSGAGGRHGDWWTTDLDPGTLLHLPPRTPHRVVCHGRSLAVSLTWGARGRQPAARPSTRPWRVALAAWDVASGYAETLPPPSRDRVFVQVPAVAGDQDAAGRTLVWTGDGRAFRLPRGPRRILDGLGRMPSFSRRAAGPLLAPLLETGIVGPRDLPLRIVPDNRRTLDGWRFA